MTRLTPTCVSCTPPEHDPEIIGFSDHWKVVLHPSQCGLGNVLLVARRHVARMSDLTTKEAQDVHQVIQVLEPAGEAASGAALVNLAAQRNWAYRAQNPDPPFKDGHPNPHVHWHVTPCYAQPMPFKGVVFDDPTFGEPFEWRRLQLAPGVRAAIRRRLQEQIGVRFVSSGQDN